MFYFIFLSSAIYSSFLSEVAFVLSAFSLKNKMNERTNGIVEKFRFLYSLMIINILWCRKLSCSLRCVLGPARFCPRSTEYRWPSRRYREARCDVTRVCRRHRTVSALSSWIYGIICFTSWLLPLTSRPLDAFQPTQVECWQNRAALGWIEA